MYSVFETSDLPGGVVNIVTGDKDALMKTLAEHDDVEGAWYFGSATGVKAVELASAANMKRTWASDEDRDWMNVDVGEGRAAGGVPARVKRQVPADCEQPRGHVFPDALPVLPAQAEECLLHDIARRVQVAEQPLRIAEQRSLVRLQCFDHPFGFRRPGHAPSKETTDQGRFY
jgi:hypothetical protein